MRLLEVVLIACQLALVVCLPQDVSFVQPGRLQLSAGPAESVSLGFSNDGGQRVSVPFDFRRVVPETFVISSDRNQNQFASGSPSVVTVTFAEKESHPAVHFVQQIGEGQGNSAEYVRAERPSHQVVDYSGQRPAIVFEGAPQPRPDRVASFERENEVVDQQRRYIIIPSRQTTQDRLELNDKPEQRLPNLQSVVFWSPGFQTGPGRHQNEGYLYSDATAPRPITNAVPVQEIPSSQPTSNAGSQRPLGIPNRGQTVDSTQQYPISGSLPNTGVEKKAAKTGADSTLVTLLTAPSNDPRSPNTLMITKKPCEICCVGNEVEPCKSCCAHTPLLNPKTLKTVVG